MKTEPEFQPLPFDPKKEPTCPRCGGALFPVVGSRDLLCKAGHRFTPNVGDS